MKRVYLGVGSNLGLREEQLKKAKILLNYHLQIQFKKSSPVYETEPVGGPPQGKYLNAVWEIQTNLAPKELLYALQEIERSLGRKRVEENGPRPIDLDILFYEDQVVQDPDLVIPHPKIPLRWFVLKPLSDLAPNWIHPVLGKSIAEMLETCHASP
jgi:2-amino-4-hydroxy-6-hydroxymethyldihydropteridine diphosphokinase